MTKPQLIKAIEAEIAEEQENIDLHDHVVHHLKKFEGKQVSKRMATHMSENLPKGYRLCSMHYIAQMTYLRFWKDASHNDYIDLFLCYDSNKTYREGSALVKYSGFRDSNCAYGAAAVERNRERTALLKNIDTLFPMIRKFHRAFVDIKMAVAGTSETKLKSVEGIMDKVYANITLKVIIKKDSDIDAGDVINELEIEVSDTTGKADIEDFELTDYEIIESK